MKRWMILFFLWSFQALALDPEVARLEKTQAPAFNPPRVAVHHFSNGLQVYHLENRELPLLEIKAFLEFGSIHEPESKKGLVDLIATNLRTGGTESYSPATLDQILDQNAISIEASGDSEYSTLSLKTRRVTLDQALDIFFQVLLHPRFDEEKFEMNRKLYLDQIKRRNEDPMGVAYREFAQQLYGNLSVWARRPTEETIRAIIRDDMVSFHRMVIAPNRIRLAVSGDIRKKELLKRLEPYVGVMPFREVILPEPPKIEKKWEASIDIIDQPVTQSSIIMGHFGERRHNPDKFALILANYVLGQSTFGSRLGSRVRTDLGLAYAVNSYLSFETDYGLFEIIASTKTESTLQVIEEGRSVLASLQQNPITRGELDDARNSILNQLIFQYEDSSQIVWTKLLYDFYGYPKNYLEYYQAQIRGVSLEDVGHVVAKYFFPDRLKVLVVGNLAAMKHLEKLGEYKVLPLDND